MTTYYLEKVGNYGHGVFWIGEDLQEGIRQANIAAKADRDDYHEWAVRRFKPKKPKKAYDRDYDYKDVVIYSVTKGQEGFFPNKRVRK
jgi:hypothetical protein